MAHKITVREIPDIPDGTVATTEQVEAYEKGIVVFEQRFENIDLRDLVLKLNAQPRRKRRAKADSAS